MEIIKHGSLYKKEHSDIKYTIVCDGCGCEFVADLSDFLVYVTDRKTLAIEVKCPECYSGIYTDVENRATKEELNIILEVNGVS